MLLSRFMTTTLQLAKWHRALRWGPRVPVKEGSERHGRVVTVLVQTTLGKYLDSASNDCGIHLHGDGCIDVHGQVRQLQLSSCSLQLSKPIRASHSSGVSVVDLSTNQQPLKYFWARTRVTIDLMPH